MTTANRSNQKENSQHCDGNRPNRSPSGFREAIFKVAGSVVSDLKAALSPINANTQFVTFSDLLWHFRLVGWSHHMGFSMLGDVEMGPAVCICSSAAYSISLNHNALCERPCVYRFH